MSEIRSGELITQARRGLDLGPQWLDLLEVCDTCLRVTSSATGIEYYLREQDGEVQLATWQHKEPNTIAFAGLERVDVEDFLRKSEVEPVDNPRRTPLI